MRKLCKVVSAMICLTVLLILSKNAMQVHAEENKWIYLGGEEWSLKGEDGTDIIAKIKGRMLHIQGTGAVPGFSGDAYGNRPWHNKEIYSIKIDDGITSVGKNAFACFPYLHDVTMNIGTFIEEPSAFDGLPQNTIFYINGMNIVHRDIGSIPYTNIDYLVTFMQAKNYNYQFRVANRYISDLIQSKAAPRIVNLSQLDVSTSVQNPNYPLLDCNSQLKIVSGDTSDITSISIITCQQGREALTAYSFVIGDNQFATTYNITVSDKTAPIKQVATPYTFQITVPAALQYPGRQFTLLQIVPGAINLLTDEDNDDTTITFTTNVLTSSCALVYKDIIP